MYRSVAFILSLVHTFRSEHTLPVTAVQIGHGEASAMVITSRLDRTVKVREDGVWK